MTFDIVKLAGFAYSILRKYKITTQVAKFMKINMHLLKRYVGEYKHAWEMCGKIDHALAHINKDARREIQEKREEMYREEEYD